MKQTARLHVGSVEENGIRAPYDSIQATVSLSA